MNSQKMNELDQLNKEIKQLQDKQQKLRGKELINTLSSMDILLKKKEQVTS